MALAEDGAVQGSVSGGCIEDELVARYTLLGNGSMPSAPPEFLKFGVSADEAHRFGLPCGGTLELLLEFNPDVESLVDLVDQLEKGRLVLRETALSDGRVELRQADAPLRLHVDDDHVINTFGPEYRMLLIGAGQLAEYLAIMAQFSGFSVTLCDPRPEYIGSWQVTRTNVLTEMPDDAVSAFRPDRRSCIVALSHDPKLDDLALLQALESPAFYVGAIGSRRNAQSRRQRMVEHLCQTEATVARIRSPIGIYIGSKTPPEIAVSIMAEILATKNAVELPSACDVSTAKNAPQVSLPSFAPTECVK